MEKGGDGQIAFELAENVNSSAEMKREDAEARVAKKIVAMEIDLELLEKLEKLKGENSWNELLNKLLADREEHLEKQKPEIKKEATRYIPVKIKKFVIEKTNGVCAFPGCRKRFKIIHHSERFALEKTHDGDRMYGLCKEHERIAHHGLIKNEEKSASEWKVKLRPDEDSVAYGIDRMVMGYRKIGEW